MMFLRWSLEGFCQGLKKADPKLWGFHNPQTLQVLSKVLLFDNFYQEPQLKYIHSKSHYCTFLRKANWGQLSCLMRFWWATKTISPKTMRSQSGRAGHSVQLVKSPLLGPSYAWQTSWLWFPGWRTSLQMLQGWANRQTAWASVWENNPLWTNQEARAGLHQKTSFYPALLLETLWKSSNLAFLISEGKIMPVKRYYPAMRSWAIKCQVFFFFPKSVFPSVAHKLLEMHHNAVFRNCFFILRPTKNLKSIRKL